MADIAAAVIAAVADAADAITVGTSIVAAAVVVVAVVAADDGAVAATVADADLWPFAKTMAAAGVAVGTGMAVEVAV